MEKKIIWVRKVSRPEDKRIVVMPQDLWFVWGNPESVVIEWERGKEYAIIRPE